MNDKGSIRRADKRFNKLMSGLYLATQMIAQYAADAKCYKIAVMILISEYLIICYWKCLHKYQLFINKIYDSWRDKFCHSYEKWCEQYYFAVRECCEEKDAFPFYNIVEQKVLLYEVIGFLTSYAYYLSDTEFEKVSSIVKTIVCLINNNPQFWYAPYDGHISIVTMICRLIIKVGIQEEVSYYLNTQTMYLMNYYMIY